MPKRHYEPSLFSTPDSTDRADAPLAERMRPKDFADFVGQDDIIALDRPLRRAIETDTLSSVIFWGPPGTGKTTLAHIIARHTKAEFVLFSAVTAGLRIFERSSSRPSEVMRSTTSGRSFCR